MTGHDTAERMRLALGELRTLDLAVYRAVAGTPSPTVDRALSRLSRAADHSLLWLSIAAALALRPGAPRRAACRGVTSIAIASGAVNLAGKRLLRRQRPDRLAASVPAARRVRMPDSGSFPSGHAASAFAFAAAAGGELPWAALPLHLLAATVAYSRVHAGVHFPADVIVGAVTGAVIGASAASPLTSAARRRSAARWRTTDPAGRRAGARRGPRAASTVPGKPYLLVS